MSEVVLVDYGCGNLFSIQKRLEHLGVEPKVSEQADEIASADRLILPGVGHFGRAMENLRERNLVEVLTHCAFKRRIPILGICLGMQLMARRSEEGGCAGLGWLEADVVALRVSDATRFKVPHIGWNQVARKGSSRLLRGIEESAEFYFAHAFQVTTDQVDSIAGQSDYGVVFTSVLERQNLFGVQFHPEISHDAGEILLCNFLAA